MCILRNNLFKFVFIYLCTFVALSKAYADTAYYPAGHNGDGMCVVENLGVTSGESGAIKALWCPDAPTNLPTGTTVTLNATTLGICSYTTTCANGYHIQNEDNSVKSKVETISSTTIGNDYSLSLSATCVAQDINCSAGKYLPASAETCQTCPAGSYCPGGTFTYTGNIQGLKLCPAGSYTNNAGQSECSLCSTAGKTSSAGAVECFDCPNKANVTNWATPQWADSGKTSVINKCVATSCSATKAYNAGVILNSEVTQVEYVQSDGTAYIETPYTANQKSIVEIKYAPTIANQTSAGVFGSFTSNTSSGANRFQIYFNSSNLSLGIGATNSGTFYDGYNTVSDYTVVLNAPEKTVSVNGVAYTDSNFIMGTNTAKTTLFAINQNTLRTAKSKIYYAIIMEKNGSIYTVKHYFVPAKQGTTYGMYDTVGGVFYENKATSGSFTGGPVVNTADVTAKYQNACNPCPAGSYCLGGQDTGTVCPIGSYSAGNTDKCTVCGATDAPADTKGKTTSGTGKTSCDATCENKDNNNVKTWETASWNTTTHTADNVCKATACNASYAFTEKVQSGKNLFNPSASTTTIGNYFGLPAGQYAGQNYQLTVRLKEGKTVPTGVSFGVVFRRAGSSSASAYWLVSSGSQINGKANFSTIPETATTVGIACSPQNQTTWNEIIDAFDIQLEAGTTSTAYEPYGSAYINSCTTCPSGSYCLGDQDTGNLCPIGSYSTGGTDTCTECADSETTRGVGSENNDACMDCPNKTGGVANWANNSFDSTTGTMSNLCSVTSCNTKYAYNSATLPSGYTRLEYIEANGTQQIDTGYMPSDNGTFGFALDIKFTNTSAQTIFGYSGGNGGYWEVAGGQTIYSYISTNITGNNYSVIDRNVIEGSMTLNSSVTDKVVTVNNVYMNDVSVAQTIQRKTESIDGISTFKLPLSSSYPLHAYIYGITQHKDGDLVRNLIPAKDSNGAVGMYDTVSGDFKTSAITGTAFIAGPEITMSGACTICPAGDYCTGGAEQKCDTGYYSLGGTSTCDSCVKGAYTNLSGQSACTPCQDGNTTSGTGQSTCDTKCSNNSGFVNTWTNVTWSATASGDSVTNSCKITNCSAGAYYGSTGDGSCTACPSGSYKATSGHIETSCDLCDSGKTSSMGATASSQCTACPNAVGVPTGAWVSPSWNETSKTVDNKCSLTKCSPTYKYNNKMLPDGYTQLEYIESTGTQYIDTGVVFSTTDTLETELMVTNLNATKHMISIGGQTSPAFFQIAQTSTLLLADFGSPSVGRVSTTETTSVGNKVSLKANAATKEFYVNNNLVGKAPGSDFIGNAVSIKLFSAAGEPYIRFYSFKIAGKINLIPALRNSDNVIGMYDTVSGTFFTNSGTGTFTAPTTTVTQGASSDYQNICSVCVAGNYCPGGTGNAAKQEACAVGSWSDAGASVCTACTAGKTTSAPGTAGTSESACATNCPGTSGAHFNADWKSVNWSANTVTNLCKFNSCVVGYHVTAGNYSSSNYSSGATADTCDANTIYIDWDENGGTAITPNGTCVYDGTITFPESTTKTNYRFNGWAL